MTDIIYEHNLNIAIKILKFHFLFLPKDLWSLIHSIPVVDKNKARVLDKKLEICRNQANNPDSSEYKKSQIEALNREDDEPMRKYVKLSEDSKKRDDSLIEKGIASVTIKKEKS